MKRLTLKDFYFEFFISFLIYLFLGLLYLYKESNLINLIELSIGVLITYYCLSIISNKKSIGNSNPIITIGLVYSNKLSYKQAFQLSFYQFLGGILSGFIWNILTDKNFDEKNISKIGIPILATERINPLNGFLFEFIFSFLIGITYFFQEINPKLPHFYTKISNAIVYSLGIICCYEFQGACFNPMRYFTYSIIIGNFNCLEVYTLAPVLGFIFAFSYIKIKDNIQI